MTISHLSVETTGVVRNGAGPSIARRPSRARTSVRARLGIAALVGIVVASGAVVTRLSLGETTSPGGPEPVSANVAGFPALTFTTADSRRTLGKDGRLTVLLLGSDARPSHSRIRTDAIMIVSVDPVTGRAAAVSIPRDMINFPLSSRQTFPGKINALYAVLAQRSNNPGGQLRTIIGKALGIEIDAYVLVGFMGVRKLIDRIGGVNVTVARTFYDATYWVNPRHRGWGLTRGPHHLNGTSALIFARTRHGDNDYERARRQQQLVTAASGKVEMRGVLALAALIASSKGLVRTDLPMTIAPLIFDIVSRADLTHARRTVFGPRTFASNAGASNNVLKLAVCRQWIRANFPPIHPGNAWLPPVPPPPPGTRLPVHPGASGQPISWP